LLVLCAAVSFSFQGCQFAPKYNPSDWLWKKEATQTTPDRVLPVWTDSVFYQTNQPGIRGFGGRIYFYGKENTTPVEVDGSLAVYVFDADDASPSDQKPLRKFMFTADQFKTHMSKTSIGPSYSVWLPWGEVGGTPMRLSLIARFEGREGGTTISDPTIKMLPGVPVSKEVTKSDFNSTKSNLSPVSLAGHEGPAKSSSKKSEDDERKEIETIDLPPAFQRHLRGTNRTTTPSQSVPKDVSVPTVPINSAATQQPSHGEVSDSSGETDAKKTVIAPITTQVYDYRTRGRFGSSTFSSNSPKKPKNDFREGRWIKSVARDTERN